MAEAPSIVLYDTRVASVEVTTAAGFLAGYSGRTREGYTLGLRQCHRWRSKIPMGHCLTRLHSGRTSSNRHGARRPEPAALGKVTRRAFGHWAGMR
ncbi:MAG: hypothetical protein M3P34_07535 [Actinomycetota bacterium]|nr:hypothetical protein [Actinomycetota bacterium]